MDKEQFLGDVMHEINMIKQHATPEEIARLDIRNFNPTSINRCIYGQLTRNCTNLRAKELMDVACIRVMDLDWGTTELTDRNIDDVIETKVNGEYKGQTWEHVSSVKGLIQRKWQYLSALEGYITTKGAKNEDIIKYLKGEIQTLTL